MRWRKIATTSLCSAVAIAITLSSGLVDAVGGLAKVGASGEVNWALGKPYTCRKIIITVITIRI